MMCALDSGRDEQRAAGPEWSGGGWVLGCFRRAVITFARLLSPEREADVDSEGCGVSFNTE